MRPRSPRIPLLLASAVLAAGLAAWWWRGRGEPELFRVGPVAQAALDLLAERARPPGETAPFSLEPIDELRARLLFPHLNTPANRFDPHLVFRYRPRFEERIEYPEHPDGEWRIVTNGRGLRMDADVRAAPPDLRVLVIGDSHTDGICNNDEGFPHLAAETLRAARPERSVEVLNAGRSGYSFYNYLAAPAAFAELDPDALVVCVFGGNDFSEVVVPHLWHQRLPPPSHDLVGPARMDAAREHVPAGVLPQGPLQAALIERNPHLEPFCLEASLAAVAYLDGRCDERGLPWGVLYLPPRLDAQPATLSEAYRAAERALGVGAHGADATRRMADALLARLAELEVPARDLTAAFARAEEPLYWDADHHVNLRGNRVVAAALADLAEELARAAR